MANKKTHHIPVELRTIYHRGSFAGFQVKTEDELREIYVNLFDWHNTPLDELLDKFHRALDPIIVDFVIDNGLNNKLL